MRNGKGGERMKEGKEVITMDETPKNIISFPSNVRRTRSAGLEARERSEETEIINLAIARLDAEARALMGFQCWICSARPAMLLRSRASLWPRTPEECRAYGGAVKLAGRLLCRACLASFKMEPGTISGFLEHGGKQYRLTRSKRPVAYDYDRWLTYLRRNHSAWREALLGGA